MDGIVYILSNPAMPGLLKIGMTDKKDVLIRMKESYTTGVPVAFDCVFACIVKENAEVEKTLHAKFARRRLNPKREFFRLGAVTAVKALKVYELENITPGFRETTDTMLSDTEKEARWEVRDQLEQTDPSIAEAKDLHITIEA